VPMTNPHPTNAQAAGGSDLVQQALESAKTGDKEAARTLLRRAAECDPRNEQIWLLAASLAPTLEEAITHVEQVLLINPRNEKASAWLARVRPPEKQQPVEMYPVAARPIKVKPAIPEPVASKPVVLSQAAPQPAILQPASPQPTAQQPASPQPSVPKPTAAEPAISKSAIFNAPVPEWAAAKSKSLERLPAVKQPGESAAVQGSEPQWRCPLCEMPAVAQVQRCSHCHAVADLALVASIARHDKIDENVLMQAIERCWLVLEKGPDAETHARLALAHLNLNQSAEAFAHLQEACRLRPTDRAMHTAFHALRQRKLVVIADESETVRDSISGLLEGHRIRTRLATNGFQALSLIEEEMPDLILAAVSMPRMGGFELCKVLRGNASTKGIPFVLLADKPGLMERARGTAAGVTDYATRRLDTPVLLRCLKKYLPDSTLPDLKLESKTLLKI
jgi:twitching motility two-component system response regulator PilG